VEVQAEKVYNSRLGNVQILYDASGVGGFYQTVRVPSYGGEGVVQIVI